jgi:hypothetical protein
VATTAPDGDRQIPSRLTVDRNSCKHIEAISKAHQSRKLSDVFTNAKDRGLTIEGDRSPPSSLAAALEKKLIVMIFNP